METALARITKYRLRKKHHQSFVLTKLLPVIVIGAAAYLVSTLSPAPIIVKSSQRFFSEGLKIELDRSSPAFAAMEDTLLGNQLTDFNSISLAEGAEDSAPVLMLAAGERSATEMVHSIQRENRREELLMAQAKLARKAQEEQMIQAAAQAFEDMAAKFATSTPNLSSAPSSPQMKLASAQAASSLNQSSEQSQQELAQTWHDPSQDVKPIEVRAEPIEISKTIHLAEIGMTREEFMREFFMPLATSDSSDVAPTTLVAGAAGAVPFHPRRRDGGSINQDGLRNEGNRRIGGLSGINFVRPAVRAGSSAALPTRDVSGSASPEAAGLPASNNQDVFAESTHSRSPVSEVSREPALNSASSINDASAVMHQLTLAGEFEFANGLALTNPADNVVIYRENDGQVFEQAAVWIKKGSYEIFMEKSEGDLVAELRNAQGDLLGRARLELAKLNSNNAKNPYRMSGINLKIVPVPQGVSGQVLALGASGRQPLADARVAFESLPFDVGSKKTGRFEEPALMEGSAVGLEIHHPGYLPTRTKAFAGADNSAILLPAKAVRAIQAMQPEAKDHSMATIMGIVTKAHSPVSGAQVMLATAGEDRKVIYFNAKNEPDSTLEATGPNGMYAIYGVGAAEQKVRATWGPTQSDAVIVSAHDRFAEQADLELIETRTAKLRVFDAFRTDWPLAAQVQNLGSEEPSVRAPRDSSGVLKFKTGQRGLFLDVDAGQNYEAARMIVDRDRKSIYLPMIQTSWLERLHGSQKVSNEIHTGTVVGFIQGNAPFEVQMDEKSVGRSSKLYYFNRRGEILSESVGEPGGGFIIFNLPEGSRSLLIQAKGMSKSYAATVQVESRVTNIINHWMR